MTDRVPALASGVVLALLLPLLAPSTVVIPMASPVTALAPVAVAGVHGVEENYGHHIRWTAGRARMRWPGRIGVAPAAVTVTLAGFPGRQPDQLQLHVNGRVTRHPVPEGYGDVRVELPLEAPPSLDVALLSATTRPPGDGRELGVRVESITIENRPRRLRLGGLASLSALTLVALGGLAWWSGGWLAGATASTGRRRATAASAWSVLATALWLGGADLLAVPWIPIGAASLAGVTAVLFTRAGHERRTSAAAALIVGVQALVVLRWFPAAFVDVPSWDLWEMVPLLVDQGARGFAWSDLFASHNEHRPVVARAVILANIALSHWNHWYELWVLLGTVAVHVVVYLAVIRHAAPDRPAATLLAVAGVGTFVASATQWENLLRPWQMTALIGAAAVSVALIVLCRARPTWLAWLSGAVAMLAGTGAFASCLVAWPVGGIALFVRRGPQWPLRTAVWLVLATAVGVAYLHGLERPAALPPPARLFSSVADTMFVLQGALIGLAMPVWYTPLAIRQGVVVPWDHIPMLGAAAAVLGLALAVLAWRRRAAMAGVWLWPSLLMMFALGACLVTAIGRVPMGLSAMTASRYIALTSLFWVGVILLLTVYSPLRGVWARRAGLTLAAIVIALGLQGWRDSRPFLEADYLALSLGRDALLRGDVLGAAALFPSPPVLDARQQELRRRGLSLFRPGARD